MFLIVFSRTLTAVYCRPPTFCSTYKLLAYVVGVRLIAKCSSPFSRTPTTLLTDYLQEYEVGGRLV